MQSIYTLHPELASWINNKKIIQILTRLIKEKLKVPYKWWVYIQKYTRLSKSSHF